MLHRLYYVMLDTTKQQQKRESTYSNSAMNYLMGMKSSSTVAEVLSTIIIAAYITAFESVTTDLFGFVPKLVQHFITASSTSSVLGLGEGQQQHQLILHCGNFGILLLNSQWINIDGGQRALSMLEKMVEVTMMRGAQSGGVVTFEPSNSGVKVGGGGGYGSNPVIRGVRSRVVNAKRTVLSQGVRKKIEGDNCGMIGSKKLKGWNDVEFNATGNSGSSSDVAKRLVRGFFGHTRFATSSKASLDGTHPHQWTPRRTLSCYGFQSKEAALSEDGMMDESIRSDLGGNKKRERHAVGTGMAQSVGPKKKVMRVKPMAQLMGVENFITHNGKLISGVV